MSTYYVIQFECGAFVDINGGRTHHHTLARRYASAARAVAALRRGRDTSRGAFIGSNARVIHTK